LGKPDMRRLKRYFLAGLAVVLPTALTTYVLWFLFVKLDAILGTFIRKKAGVTIPGIGLAAVIIIVFVAGALATNLLGRKVIRGGQRVLESIPLFNRVYVAIRQISDAFLSDQSTVFRRVALVEFPRAGMYSICFVTSEDVGEFDKKIGKKAKNVFLPTTPNPTTGYMLVVPASDLIPLDLTVEEGLKLVISGGSVVPESIRRAHEAPAAEAKEAR
jgi:uncharacterized membrane protein